MKTKEEYPMYLTANHVSEVLSCSKRYAYEIMEHKEFPLIRIGRMKRVNREDFFKWVETKRE